MNFSGYWVCMDAGKVTLRRTAFDETELDPLPIAVMAQAVGHVAQDEEDRAEPRVIGIPRPGDARLRGAARVLAPAA